MLTNSCFGCLYEEKRGSEDPCCNCPEGEHWVAKASSINPNHYPDSRHGDVISLCLNGEIGFCEGNVIKYVTRWRKKNGLEDLMKAKTYLDRLIRFYKNKELNP